MPELPEVETVRRGLEPALTGKTIRRVELRRKDLRIPFPEGMQERLEGAVLLEIRRRSKYLLVHVIPAKAGIHVAAKRQTTTESFRHSVTNMDSCFRRNDGYVLLIHLGMSGKVLLKTIPYIPQKHDHVLITFNDGTLLVYNDARRFGLMTLCATAELDAHELLAHLGPEPLEEEFSADYLHNALKSRNTPVKHALMDAGVVVGVGNIYASESLFRSSIHPARKACSLKKQEITPLVGHIREVLQEAIDSGGSTLRDYVRSDGGLGYFQHRFRVYGREHKPCVTCATPIERMQQQGRSTFYCPSCQKR